MMLGRQAIAIGIAIVALLPAAAGPGPGNCGDAPRPSCCCKPCPPASSQPVAQPVRGCCEMAPARAPAPGRAPEAGEVSARPLLASFLYRPALGPASSALVSRSCATRAVPTDQPPELYLLHGLLLI
jgi:hypothetical protein